MEDEFADLTAYLLRRYSGTARFLCCRTGKAIGSAGDFDPLAAIPPEAHRTHEGLVAGASARGGTGSSLHRSLRRFCSARLGAEPGFGWGRWGPRVVDSVLGEVAVDALSYSAWEATEGLAGLGTEAALSKVRSRLELALRRIRAGMSPGQFLYLGEFVFRKLICWAWKRGQRCGPGALGAGGIFGVGGFWAAQCDLLANFRQRMLWARGRMSGLLGVPAGWNVERGWRRAQSAGGDALNLPRGRRSSKVAKR